MKQNDPPLFSDRRNWTSAERSTDITLRDLFAAAALAGTEANPSKDYYPKDSAELAYKLADAMLAAREEEQAGE